MLVIQEAADDITTEDVRKNGIANLITAGEVMTDRLVDRF
jgi:hypothetical protein